MVLSRRTKPWSRTASASAGSSVMGARKRGEYRLARGVPITKPATSREIDLGSIRLHLLDGEGLEPPILLLHPNRTNARVWDFVVEHSTLPNRFLAPDQRGHGLSDYPGDGYLYEDYIADLLALLDELGVQHAHVVGAATGGNIALLLASDHSSRVASLSVIDPGLSLDPAINRRVQTQIANEHTFDSLKDARSRMPFSDRWSDEMKEHYARYSFAIADDGKATWRYHLPGVAATEHMLEAPIWDRLSVNCPTLAIRGGDSEVFPAHNLEKLCSLIPQAQRQEIDADHRPSDRAQDVERAGGERIGVLFHVEGGQDRRGFGQAIALLDFARETGHGAAGPLHRHG